MADDLFTQDLFRFLQLLCEGHNNGTSVAGGGGEPRSITRAKGAAGASLAVPASRERRSRSPLPASQLGGKLGLAGLAMHQAWASSSPPEILRWP